MTVEWAAFETRRIATRLGALQVRVGGDGPPLVLLHGFPQTGHAWRHVAPALAGRFRVVVPDLPGYGASDVPEAAADGSPYDKRSLAFAVLDAADALGLGGFALAGHDRGGRVAYRLALDHPGRVVVLALVDIASTRDVWKTMDHAASVSGFHWPLLAQPAELVVPLLAANPDLFFGHLLDRWAGSPSVFTAADREAFLAPLRDPRRIAAIAADYRAGSGLDVAHDDADVAAGRKIACPVLTLWGRRYLKTSPAPLWRRLAGTVSDVEIDCGHFLAEEAPDTVAAAMAAFFTGQAPA